MSHSHKLDTTKGVGTAPSFLQCMKLYTVHVALPNVMRPCCQCTYHVVVVLNLYLVPTTKPYSNSSNVSVNMKTKKTNETSFHK